MRRGLSVVAAVVVVVGAALVWWSGLRPGTGTPSGGVPEGAERWVVEYVHDGDTLSLERADGGVERVRLIGVDTPEGPGASGSDEPECGADEAREALRRMAPVGAPVWAAADIEERDRYGRALLYVWTQDGTFVNRELVASGAGEAIRVGRNDTHYAALLAAQHDAQAEGLGIWGMCPEFSGGER
ncbi:hypothetical protein B5M43_014785 [Microbacterium sp. MEC084]|uniref:thermonuclease family protein n=1 Tax=Microbacterium sp. MEC084 TaxID=1963027 RepID=UPI001E406C77|nr:thermonuclease family protein [Microbacterium sp. MEC084]MCD1270070.1 hypothetical protein [Microbacterium sp. MEC084]